MSNVRRHVVCASGAWLRLSATLTLFASGCASELEEESALKAEQHIEALADSGVCTEAENQRLTTVYTLIALGWEGVVNSDPSTEPARWDSWFDLNYTQAEIDEVKRVFGVLGNSTLGSPVICEHNDGTGGSGDLVCQNPLVFAFVREGDPSIHLCGKFFAQGTIGQQVNSIVHEAAHLGIPSFTDFTPSDSAADAIDLANNHPADALKNASNYAHFVTNDPSIVF